MSKGFGLLWSMTKDVFGRLQPAPVVDQPASFRLPRQGQHVSCPQRATERSRLWYLRCTHVIYIYLIRGVEILIPASYFHLRSNWPALFRVTVLPRIKGRGRTRASTGAPPGRGEGREYHGCTAMCTSARTPMHTPLRRRLT